MFYDRFLELCAEKGVKPTNACVEAGLSRGLAAKWKSTKTEKPSADALEKMSAYFGKSIDEILGKEKSPSKIGEGKHRIPDEETLKLLELLETREDIRYLAAASERATPEHVKATAKMFDELYGRNQDK